MDYLGIDPGKTGGIAFIGSGEPVAIAMPPTERDIYDAIASRDVEFAVIEKVHSMPGQGVASSFTFGANYGFLRGCLVALEIPFADPTPQKWMRALGIRTKKKSETPSQWKNHLRQQSQQLFPMIKITRATADALLIAAYCYRLRY